MPLPATASEIVLLGAGVAHLEVLRRFARRPPPGARLTLVTPEPDAPYAGRLPALIRGDCARSEACIDLALLSAAAGARLILADPTGIDSTGRMLELAGRPPMPFDLLSVDLDGESAMPDVPDACTSVSPPGRFLARLPVLEAALPDGARIAVIGGGPAGTELALALARRFAGRLRLVLVCETPEPLPAAPPLARRAVRAALVDAGVELASAVLAGALIEGRLALSDGSFLPADAVLWAGDRRAPGVLAEAGLACDAAGRVLVDAAQRSVSHACIFATGDCAAPPHDHRAGRRLAASLRQAARGQKLRILLRGWRLPQVAPTVVDLGGGRAIAWSSELAVAGDTVGRAKDWLDRRRMRAYTPRPRPPHVAAGRVAAPTGGATPAAIPAPLHFPLPRMVNPNALVGFGTPDHVAVLTPPTGQALVQSVASLRTCLDDPFVFGQIAAAHALSEQYAMGARPWTALAVAAVPAGSRRTELGDMLAGAAEVLGADGCALAGGHRAVAAEASLGFAINGLVEPATLQRKAALRTGDALVLTKPLGTGIILAGHARGAVRASWLCAATGCMRTSNAAASRILRAHGASTCVAVNGFGLAGHLGEMLGASRAAAVLWWDAVPTLPGALELLTPGGGSRRRGGWDLPVPAGADALAALLADPETSGGLLAGMPPARADACLEALQAAGLQAAIIGVVVAAEPGTPMIRMERG